MSKKAGLSVRERRTQQQARQKRQRLVYYGLVVGGVLVIVSLLAVIRQTNAPTLAEVALPDSLAVPLDADGKAWGPLDALVLIEKYSDFQ
ncbi:MAG: hypothetical protein ACE5E7_04595 [Anaerolineae bacterium]